MLVERLISVGPAGTPLVAEFAAHGLIGPFGTTVSSARSWIGDALTVRHRLPRLWERVAAGEVHAWQARQVANLTAHLSVAVVGIVDEQTSRWITQLPWRSFLKLLDATMLETDEKAYREREKMIAAKREVRATQSEDGLRTLIARGEAGDVAMLLALHQRVAECLADEGDDDPLQVRLSKAMGWIANPARVLDLLARHAGDPDPHRDPWEQVAAHQADPTDPWADDLPPAGWETPEHGNYHQPSFDEDDWWTQPRSDQPGPDGGKHQDWQEDPPPDPQDLAWYHQHTDRDARSDDASGIGETDQNREPDDGTESSSDARPADLVEASQTATVPTSSCQSPTDAVRQRWPSAFRPPGWKPLSRTDLAACAPTVVMHVHLTDQTLRDGRGVVRTPSGPILLEQLQRFLLQHEAHVKVYPVIDPAETAAADSYEIPLRLRRAMQIRHPRSVFPRSPTTSRTDLDHTPAYLNNGTPGQTGMRTLGPLSRSEHRAKTVGKWRSKQPEPETYLWRSPEGWIMITTNQGTLDLGHTTWATQLWDATN